MVWKSIHVGKFIAILRMFFSLDTISKFKNTTTSCINAWIGRVVYYQRETMTKRLQKRQHRLCNTCKTVRRGSCKCNCSKCANIRMNKQRVMETDLLENLAYQHRVSQEIPSMTFIESPMTSEITEEISSSRQDHRDLQQSKYDGLAWWINTSHHAFMPPLLLEHATIPTQSECSITSDFYSGSAGTPDSPELSRSLTPSSDDSDYKSCEDVSATLPMCTGSKSDPRIPRSMEIKLKSVAKSVSIPLGQRPKELRGSKTVAKRKTEMKRPVRRTTSHTTDCFSNCVKCSRIVSRPYKNIIR